MGELEVAAKRFESFAWEETYAAGQDAFEVFNVVTRNGLRTELGTVLEGIDGRPYAEVMSMMVVIGFGPLREGARTFASFAGGAGGEEPPCQVTYDRLVEGLMAINNPLSREARDLQAAIEGMTALNWVLTSVEQTLNRAILKRFPALKECADAVGRLVLAGLLNGVRVEFLIPRLMAERLNEARFKVHAAAAVAPREAADEAVIARWRQALGRGEEPRAWPEDGLCLCKEDLLAHLRCCDESAPVDPEDLKNAGVDYLLKRPCCNMTLTGIRCGVCARYYTWSRGVVPTHQKA